MFGLKRDKPLIGLDIGSHAVKAVELGVRTKGKRDVYHVVRVGYEPLPHDAIVEGTIIDGSAVSESIRALCDKAKIANKDVVISISGNSVIIKKISLPSMGTEELAESVIWEAKHNIPYPYEETNVDYAILPSAPGGGTQNLEILLVACKKDKIAAYSNVIHQARKNLAAVEVDAFALFNILEVNYPEEFAGQTLALINMGAAITTIVICEKGAPQLFRDIPVGGSFFTENIRKDLNIGHDEAEALLKGGASPSVQPYEYEAILGMNVKGLLEEIEKTFVFFEAEDKSRKKIEHIFISGGLSNIKNVSGSFEQKFGVKTTLFDPFRTIQYNEKKLDPVYYQEMAPFFAVATGLATRKREK
jgi:type IV pilus assembly protein PilM